MTMMFGSVLVWLCLILATTFADSKTIEITIPNSAWNGKLHYLCKGTPVDAGQYITSFVPLYHRNTIRHISAVICDQPIPPEQIWDCSKPENICKNGNVEALWAMAKDASGWNLPKDYGIAVGSKKRYLILQIHAPPNMTLESTSSFNSTGMRIGLTNKKPLYLSGMAIYGNIGYIPANATDFTADAFCRWPYDNTPLHGFSIHSHDMATAISGYIYRNNEFIELVRADPSYPEETIDISSWNITLQSTDYLIMRCTLTNPKSRDVKFGFSHLDQMCDLYFMYGIPNEIDDVHYRPISCGGDAQKSNLTKMFGELPQDSTLPDKEGYKKMLSPFNISQATY